VELGLEKPLLDLTLFVSSALQLRECAVNRYNSSTGEIERTVPTVNLPFSIIMKTPHAVKIIPSEVTLDEDNNDTSFVAIEANDGAAWTLLPVDTRLTVTPSSGTGRASVVVKKATSFDMGNNNFANVPLAITSTVNQTTYPDIDGAYTASDTSAVHLEKYTPAHNALIPKQTASSTSISLLLSSDSSTDAWKSFNHSLSALGCAGTWTKTNTFPSFHTVLGELETFPAIEVSFGTDAHRIRSWSLQSVGTVPIAGRQANSVCLVGTDRQW